MHNCKIRYFVSLEQGNEVKSVAKNKPHNRLGSEPLILHEGQAS